MLSSEPKEKIVHVLPLGDGQEVRFALSFHDGKTFFDIRKIHRDMSGEIIKFGKGIQLPLNRLNDFIEGAKRLVSD